MAEDQKDRFRLREAEVRLYLREKEGWLSDEPVSTPAAAVRLMSRVLMDLDREVVCAVNLDTKLRPINCSVISVGAIDRAIVPVQNIFKSAILSNAAGVILLHNHPSGDITPSSQDISLTEKAALAGWLMDVPLRDHIITGTSEGQIYSFLQKRPELFSAPQSDTLQHAAAELVREPDAVGKERDRDITGGYIHGNENEKRPYTGRTGDDNTDERRRRHGRDIYIR